MNPKYLRKVIANSQWGGGFQKPKFLKDIIIIKPNWNFRGIRRVLTKQPSLGRVWIFFWNCAITQYTYSSTHTMSRQAKVTQKFQGFLLKFKNYRRYCKKISLSWFPQFVKILFTYFLLILILFITFFTNKPGWPLRGFLYKKGGGACHTF